jgi:hypothetical protein
MMALTLDKSRRSTCGQPDEAQSRVILTYAYTQGIFDIFDICIRLDHSSGGPKFQIVVQVLDKTVGYKREYQNIVTRFNFSTENMRALNFVVHACRNFISGGPPGALVIMFRDAVSGCEDPVLSLRHKQSGGGTYGALKKLSDPVNRKIS